MSLGVDPFNDSILYHKQVADGTSAFVGESVEIHRKIAGHLMVNQKASRDQYRGWKKCGLCNPRP
jgi:hypothetical protein